MSVSEHQSVGGQRWTIHNVEFVDARDLGVLRQLCSPEMADGIIGTAYGVMRYGRPFFFWMVFDRVLWAQKGPGGCEMILRSVACPPAQQD